MKLKQAKENNSKGKEIQYPNFEMQKYIKSDRLTTTQKSLLFNLRLRMTELRSNYRVRYQGDLLCRTCGLEEESQRHILDCVPILNRCPPLFQDRITRYEDLFGQIEKQIRIVKLYELALKTRSEMIQQ